MNLSTKAATLLVIAVLGQALSGQNVADITDEPYHTLLVQNQWVRAFRIEIPPFKSTPVFKQEHDYVVITLTDSAIKQNKPGEAPIAFPRYAGDIRYIHGGIAHAMMNDETSTYRNVTVEISTPDSSKYVGYITDDAIRDVLGPG